ncbi:MAG: bifunctional biotin--[acetyl-CoA-carboxylase] ligase/biotin operon repressor BirA [Methylobacter sp.]
MTISDKQQQLLNLLADGAFHSGTQLAATLGISRSAVWKQLNGLGQWGIAHAAVSGKGYRLDKPLELLTASAINAALNPQASALISALDIHPQIDSTNRYLVEAAQHDAPSGSVCLAEHQTAGKGRRGRHWVSPYGSNIYLSILWRFQQGPAAISGLSLAIGVAVIRALTQYQIDDIGLKWPNDIYSQGKKLGGILLEVSGESDGPCSAVIGLGLNVSMPETEAKSIDQAWTDVSKMTGKRQVSRNALAAMLLNHLLPLIADYEHLGISAYLDEWRGYDCLSGNAATLFIGQQHIDGIVRGVDNNGLLLLERTNGTVQAFASGEVSFNGRVKQ